MLVQIVSQHISVESADHYPVAVFAGQVGPAQAGYRQVGGISFGRKTKSG